MLDDLLLRKALELADEGPHDQKLITVLLNKFQQPDVFSLMRHRSRRFTEDLLKVCEITELVPLMREWLDAMPVVWIPRQRFLLAAVRFDGHRFIAVSHGFEDVIIAAAEFLTMQNVVSDAKAVDAVRWGAKDQLHAKVFMRVLTDQVEGSSGIFIPHVIDEMPKQLRGATQLMAFFARLFGILHEIGHFELGHLQPSASPKKGQTVIRREDTPIEEDLTDDMALEYEADSFAALQMSADIRGAVIFLSLLSISHAARRYRGVTHPHFANRVANIHKVYGEGKTVRSDFTSGIVSLETLAAGGDYRFADDELFADIRKRLPRMPEEALPPMWLNEFQTQLIEEVKRRPDRYPRWC